MKTADDFVPRFDEEIATCWAALLRYVAEDLGAPMFAADMAAGGFESLRSFNLDWRDGAFEPAAFADVLFAVAGTYSHEPTRDHFNTHERPTDEDHS